MEYKFDPSNFIPIRPPKKAICKEEIQIEIAGQNGCIGVQVYVTQGELVEYSQTGHDFMKPAFLDDSLKTIPTELYLSGCTLWVDEEYLNQHFTLLPTPPAGLAYCSLETMMDLDGDDVMVYDFHSKAFFQVGSLKYDPSFTLMAAEAFLDKYDDASYGIDWIGLTELDKAQD